MLLGSPRAAILPLFLECGGRPRLEGRRGGTKVAAVVYNARTGTFSLLGFSNAGRACLHRKRD